MPALFVPFSLSESPFSTLVENIDKSIAGLGNEDTTTENAFRVIDQEISKHKTCIVALLKRRNTFAPISRLPPEVLCSIFHFTIEASTKKPLEWIKVSHVSHAWRNTAVNTPSLWTKLPLSNSRWTNEMLSRSKVASLSVDTTFTGAEYLSDLPEFLKTLSSVLRHSSRIRHLHICDLSRISMQEILCDLPKSTPRLESLCLTRSAREPSIMDCELPAESLCDAGHLSKLEITQCKINWDTHLSNSLTSLSIRNIAPSSRPTTTQLWNALKRMPYLEYLNLQRALPVIDEDTLFSSHERIRLDHLQQLTLIASNSEMEFFLKGISCLPTVITKVECESRATATSGSNISGLLSAVSSFISPSAKSGGLGIFQFHLCATSFRAWLNDASGLPNLEFCPNFRVSGVWDEYLKHVFAAMPLGNLTELHLSAPGRYSPKILAETFGTLPHLQSVLITDNPCAENFLDALQKMQLNANGSAAQFVYFSNLRSISMEGVSFHEGFKVHMQDTLIWRYEIGAEVQELNLENCSITAEEVDHLRRIVVNVEWDEKETGFTDSEDSERDEYDDYSDDEFY